VPGFPINLPPPPGETNSPVWNGNGFYVGETWTRVLGYATGESGWTDGLTSFHEETAGDGHYIDRASRTHAVESLLRFLPAPDGVVMDIGCSSGFLLPLLENRLPLATIIGADYVRGPLEALGGRLPSTPLLQFDLVQCPLPSASLDAAVLLNVLEHIEDDEGAMGQISRVLKPGGIAVIEVPAGPDLYDIYDKHLMHFRRYRMRDLTAKLERAGLKILERSHLGFFLYPAFWAAKKRGIALAGKSARDQQAIVSKRIQTGRSSAVLDGVMKLEAVFRPLFYYPAGIRCLVTCEKPLN
jgi:SAM-dependent methyltransferase